MVKLIRSFTLLEIIIVTAIIALLATFSIPSLLRAKVIANEAMAQSSLRTLCTAMESFRTANGSYTGATLNSLASATPSYIDSVLGTGKKQGYDFSLIVSADNQTFVCTGIPSLANISGIRSFCITDDGVIRANADGSAITDRAGCLALPGAQ